MLALNPGNVPKEEIEGKLSINNYQRQKNKILKFQYGFATPFLVNKYGIQTAMKAYDLQS